MSNKMSDIYYACVRLPTDVQDSLQNLVAPLEKKTDNKGGKQI